jgi:hypothetical protein
VRTEIVQELDPGDARLEIPWAGPAGRALRYLDLKRFPREMARLPECRRQPALAGLLRALNRPGSKFRTAKCDVWTTSRLAEDERLDFKLPFKAGCYLDLVLERAALRKRLNAHRRFAERLSQALKSFRARAQMEIVVRRCLFHPGDYWGYALTLFLHAYGETAAKAKREQARALEALRGACEKIH